jgi:hypothetical protein
MEKKLQNDVAEKYQVLKGHGIGEYHFSGHVVHLDRLNLEQADKLVKKGFPYLVEKPKGNPKPKDTPGT